MTTLFLSLRGAKRRSNLSVICDENGIASLEFTLNEVNVLAMTNKVNNA